LRHQAPRRGEKAYERNLCRHSRGSDYIGPGAIEVPLYQTESSTSAGVRAPSGSASSSSATGHPSRFFEETAIPNPGTAGFVNPRSIVAPW